MMAEELAMVKTPEIPAKGKLGFAEAIKIQEPFFQKKAQLQKDITSAEGDIAKAEQDKSEILQTGKMQAVQNYGTAQKGAMEKYEQRLQEEPLPAFIPTKDTAQDIAGLFSIVSVIGMIAGKESGLRAMSAMNGMLEGYQKGRGDLYKKEAAEFDKNFKSMLKKHEEFRREMEDAIKLATTDKEAGYQAAELAATKAGSTVVQAQLRKGDLVGAFNLVKESQQGVEKAFTLESNLRTKAEEAAERERQNRERINAANERARLQREQQLILAQLRASDTGGKGLKPGAKVTEAYIADNQLKADIQDITNDLKNNPSLVQKLEKYRVEAFLTEEGKVLNQIVNADIPSDLRQFLTKVRDMRNNYYLNISGKAVTGGEALRSYGTVPQPGDDAQGMIDKLSGMSKRVTQAISIKQQLYSLPKLELDAGNPTGLVPNENYGISSQPGRYELNQVITQGGKKYRVIDVTDPSDPELEEIQ